MQCTDEAAPCVKARQTTPYTDDWHSVIFRTDQLALIPPALWYQAVRPALPYVHDPEDRRRKSRASSRSLALRPRITPRICIIDPKGDLVERLHGLELFPELMMRPLSSSASSHCRVW